MEFLRIAVKDLVRRPAKSLYLLTAVLIPVSILSTILLTLANADSSLANVASKFGFTLSVQPKNIRPERIDQVGVVLGETLEASVVPEVTSVLARFVEDRGQPMLVSPRLYEEAEISRNGEVVRGIVAGILLDSERSARPSLALSEGVWPRTREEAVAGGTFARVHGIRVGDEVNVNSATYRVGGILENYNSSDDHMLFLDLDEAQTLFGKKDQVSLVNIQSVGLDRNGEALKHALAAANSEIPNIRAISPQQFTTLKYVLLKKTFKFLLAIILATGAVSVFSIFNIVTSALYARVREIGLLKAVGASRGQLLALFLSEYLSVGLVGGALGYGLGLVFAHLLDVFLLQLGVRVAPKPLFFAVALAMGALCSLLASYYPTYRLSGIKITESFRSQWEV